MTKSDVPRRFRGVMERRGWLGQTPVLLGVSGGSDSMSLLRLFSQLYEPSQLVVIHMDHGIRNASCRDGEFVKKRCAELNVRCVIERRPVPELSRKGESEEAAGRRLRYEVYEDAARRFGCRLAALGHTRDDLAENALMNIARGCGLWGMAGMPEQRGMYIRPLLPFRREELRDFLRTQGWSWVEDETNALNVYQRNRIRNVVMPLLAREINPAVIEHLASLAEEAQLWRKMQEEQSAALLREVSLPQRGWPCLSLNKLRRVHEFQRRELLRFVGRRLELAALTRTRIEELDRLICRSGRFVFQWGSEVDVEAGNGLLCWHPAAEKRLEVLRLSLGETARWGGWKVSLRPQVVSEEADFGLNCPLDEARPVVLQNNAEKHCVTTSFFPIIFQEKVFFAEKKQNRWEVFRHSVKYNIVAQIVLSPLVGRWREFLWN